MWHSIRRLGVDELGDCLALAQDREWLPEAHKWRLLFDVGTVYGIRAETGDLVGTAVLTCYGTSLAAVSMVLVAARHERRGLGRRLMEHVLAEAGDATVFLNATEHGRPLYERLGFVTTGRTFTHVGRFTPPPGPPGSRPFTPGDLAAVIRLDAEVNGADRSDLVRRLPGFAERMRLIERDGTVTGYAAAWRNVDTVLIGPVIARDAGDATTLIADLAGAVDGPVRLDLDDRHPQLHAWARRCGLPLRNPVAVMVRGGRSLPGDRDRWFVPVTQALG